MVRIESKEKSITSRLVNSITTDLEYSTAELIFLSELHEFKELLDSSRDFNARELVSDYLSVMMQTRHYDQIRYLDETGKELIRINYDDGRPRLVPKEELQFKGNRYYFKDIFSLGSGDIYVSPLDLNIEDGKVELPFKPMVRFGMPVFNSLGKKRGVLILNYLVSELLDRIKKISLEDGCEAMFLNSDGYWFIAPNPEDEWGFMFEERKERRFGNTFPRAWRRISGATSGQFYLDKSLFTFGTIYPLIEGQKSSTGSGEAHASSNTSLLAKDYYWKVVYRMPPEVLYEHAVIMQGEYFRIYLILLLIAAGGSWGVARVNRKKKVFEKALRESEERVRAIVKSAGEGIISIGIDSRIIFANEELARIFGYPENELIGMEIEMLMPEKYRERHRKGMERYLNSREAKVLGKRLELEGLTKEGHAFPLEMRIEETETKRIKQKIFVASMRDITERKRIEEEARRYASDLEESNRIKDLFTDIMRHDLLNPANVVLNAAEILHDNEKDEKKLEMLDLVRNNMAQFVELLENASTYSRIKDLTEIDSHMYDLGDIIKEAVHDLDFDLKEKEMSLLFKRDKTYPAKVNMLVKEVFYNLVSNAIKYGPEKSEITVKVDEQGKDWLVAVIDKGVGIDDEDKEKIFERFERVAGTSVKGTGLGLAIARRIVELHKGKIWVEDNPEGGSIFYVSLPKMEKS